jgi:thiopeptide-type bacteriocin biosynthesis protein
MPRSSPAAAARRLQAAWARPGLGWTQANLTLVAASDGYARLVCSAIPEALGRWLAQGLASEAFFMHKRPGLRLRVRSDRHRADPSLRALLGAAAADGAIAGFTLGRYDPEQRLFGGPAGLALAHAFFTADSAAVWAHVRATLGGQSVIPAAAFSTALLVRLTDRLFDRFEGWDMWCRVAELRGAPAVVPAGFGAAVETGLALAADAGALALAGLPPDAVHVLEARLAALAGAAARAVDHGLLSVALRAVVPFWIVFHWNRLGLDLTAQQALAALVAAEIAPPAYVLRERAGR